MGLVDCWIVKTIPMMKVDQQLGEKVFPVNHRLGTWINHNLFPSSTINNQRFVVVFVG